MSLKMEYHLKWNFPQNVMSFQNGMSPTIECYSKLNVTQNGLSLKKECHSTWNVTLNVISPKIECHTK